MIVSCDSVEDFIKNLQNETQVFQDAIRVNIVRRPADKTTMNPRDASKFDVIFQASAVVRVSESEEYLLQTGVVCGKDYNDGSGDTEGSAHAAKLKETLETYAASRSWKTLPGIIGY